MIEALSFESMSRDVRQSASELAQFIEHLPSQTVDPALKQAVFDVRQNAQEQEGGVSTLRY